MDIFSRLVVDQQILPTIFDRVVPEPDVTASLNRGASKKQIPINSYMATLSVTDHRSPVLY